MTPSSPILFSFFNRIRKEIPIQLDTVQYTLFMKALYLGEGWKDKEDMYRLCCAFWLLRPRYAPAFRQIFNDEYPKYFAEEKTSTEIEHHENEKIEADSDDAITTPQDPTFSSPQPLPKEETSASAPKPKPNSTTNLIFEDTHLYFDNQGDAGVKAPDILAQKNTRLKHQFSFADKFLPLEDRALAQIWQQFRQASVKVPGEELDMAKIVQERAYARRVSKLWYQTKKQNAQSVVLILDHSHVMTAFEPLAQQLYRTLAKSKNFTQVSRLYFRGQPYIEQSKEQRQYHLFLDPFHHKNLEINAYWKKLPKDTLVFFFSDARHETGVETSLYFWEMTQLMRRHTPRIAWITPLPEDLWPTSNAEQLQSFLPLVSYNKKGFKQLSKIMQR